MTKQADVDEYTLWMRRIVSVVDWFDEEHEVPWNYVQRSGDGRFEAMTTLLFDDLVPEPEARDHSLGVFDTVEAARKAISAHERRIDEVNHELWARMEDFSAPMPTVH